MNLFRNIFGSANYLISFEAVVRLGSYTKAAVELNVTQPAISRQIRELERYLGFSLFHKQGGRAILTPGGSRLYNSVSTHLTEISKDALAARRDSQQRVILLHAVVVAATHWLLPALPQFHASHPGIKLRIIASDDPVDTEDNVDVWIRFGKGDWPGMWSRLLFDEVIFPICAPSIMERLGSPVTLMDLSSAPLLQLEGNKGPWLDWRNWFACFTTQPPDQIERAMMSNYTVLLHAAVRGQGVALGWKYMVAEDLQAGRLVQPLDLGIASEYGEFLVASPERLRDPEIRTVCAWLLMQARKTRRAYRFVMPDSLHDGTLMTPAFPPKS